MVLRKCPLIRGCRLIKVSLEMIFCSRDCTVYCLFVFQVRDLDDKNGIATDSMGLAVRAKHELDMIDCEDANNNTPLSEAAG